jgi:hypothetical protein
VEALHARVWLWDGKEQKAPCWHLVATRELGSPETIKYALSNAPAETSLSRLVQMQRQRFGIERCFEDGKSESGMAGYQVRGWLAWHHYMAGPDMSLVISTSRVSLLSASISRQEWSEWPQAFTRISSFVSEA